MVILDQVDPRTCRLFAGSGAARELVPHCFPAMAHPIPFAGPQFVVHTKSGVVPVMAGCTQCAQKFFTPATLLKDALGAGEYLRAKFDSHDCQLQSKRRRWLPSEY